MKTFLRLALVSMLVVVAAPCFAGGAVQVFTCELLDTGTEQDVVDTAAEWVKAAKTMKGGENIAVQVYFPMAAEMGESDFLFILKVPTFAEWGTFMDGYGGSAANEVDKKFDSFCDCPDSRLWEAMLAK